MDTRTKILSVDEACERLAGRDLTLAVGYFDVLRSAHIRDLANPSGVLLVAVRTCPDAILPDRARAELAAALRMVDYVVIVDDRGLNRLVTSLHACEIRRLENADFERAAELKQHVERRQSS